MMTTFTFSVHTWQREYDYDHSPMKLKEAAPLRVEAVTLPDIGAQTLDKVSIELSIDLFLHPSHTIQLRDALTALIEARAKATGPQASQAETCARCGRDPRLIEPYQELRDNLCRLCWDELGAKSTGPQASQAPKDPDEELPEPEAFDEKSNRYKWPEDRR